MNRSGLTFPLACGMLGVGRGMHRYALPKKGSKDKETALATSDVYKGQVLFLMMAFRDGIFCDVTGEVTSQQLAFPTRPSAKSHYYKLHTKI